MDTLSKFSNVRVLVIGDLMLDRYWWGSVDRISPEAPVPVVRLTETTLALGGAANVAANVVGLGAQVQLLGGIGEDHEATEFRRLLDLANIPDESVLVLRDRPTSLKTRIVAHNQQVVRVDQESSAALSLSMEEDVIARASSLINEVDLVVLSDYAKGFLADRIISDVVEMARRAGKDLLVDPKGKNFDKYRGASYLTPNVREVSEVAHRPVGSFESLRRSADELIQNLSLEGLVVTRGEEGMTLFLVDADPFHVNAKGRQVYDVTGAGDTVIATIAVGLGAGVSLHDVINLANIAAGIVVTEVGTTSITKEKLAREMTSFPNAASVP
jgi:rfaE bifunctional protein kinase chain/domain